MSCTSAILTGIPLDCGNIGGIKNVWLVPTAHVSMSATETKFNVAHNSSGITGGMYSFRKGNASFNSVGARDDKNGTHFVKTDISMQFNKMTPEARKEAMELARGNVYAVVLDNNGKYWLIGYDSYVALATANGQSGANMADANSYNLTLSSDTVSLPYEILEHDLYAMQGLYHTTYGGTVNSGDTVKLSGINFMAYIVLPNGTVYETTDGVNTSFVYTGVSGEIRYYTDVNDSSLNIYQSGIRGAVTSLSNAELNFSNNSRLTSLNAPYSAYVYTDMCPLLTSLTVGPYITSVYATGCSLLAKSIGDILYTIYKSNCSSGMFSFTGGTNRGRAGVNGIDAYILATYGITTDVILSKVVGDFSNTIELNP